MSAHEQDDVDDPEVALREVRQKLIASFPDRLAELRRLIRSDSSAPQRVTAIQHLAHRLAGLAGMVGFPDVGGHASALESLATDSPFDQSRAESTVDLLERTFSEELSERAPRWALPTRATTGRPGRILTIEDDPDQRQLIASILRQGGYVMAQQAAGSGAAETVRLLKPDLVLLDIDLPGEDGYAVCRQLRSDPATAAIPIVFLTSHSAPTDRNLGFALGATDFLAKPFEPADLLIRIGHILRVQPSPTAGSSPAAEDAPLSFTAFRQRAVAALSAGPAALVLIRTPSPERAETVVRAASDEMRRKDIVGRYGDTHVVVLLPGKSAADAAHDLEPWITRVAEKSDVVAGIAEAGTGATFDQILNDADLSLAAARLSGRTVATSGDRDAVTNTRPPVVVIAEDDPDVLHILDPRLKAAGLVTVIAFDGRDALDAIEREKPSVLILDMMMPKMTGFDVLTKLRTLPGPRPRVLVVSARGREEDITRAFDLGADDYVTKPFSPLEVVARVMRLLR